MKKINQKEKSAIVEEPLDEINDTIQVSNENVFTKKVDLIPQPLFVLQGIGKALLKGLLWLLDLVFSMVKSLIRFFYIIGIGIYKGAIAIYKFFKKLGHMFRYNDWSGRLSYLVFGVSSFKHKQIGNGILYILFEIGYLFFFFSAGLNAIGMLSTLGTKVSGTDPSCTDTFCDYVVGDNSVMVLVYGLLSVFSIVLFLYIWYRSIKSGYNNYRIDNFINFRNQYDKNKDFSNHLDDLIYEEFYKGTKKSAFKKKYATEINTYIGGINNKFDENFAKYIIDETIDNSYDDFKAIKKQEKKTASFKLKYDNYVAGRAKAIKEIDPSNQIKLDKFDNKTRTHANDLMLKFRKENNKLVELKKRHAPFCSKEEIINENKYEKFNQYYKHLNEIQNDLTFYKNYDEVCSVYDGSRSKFDDKNKDNALKKVELLNETNKKIADINKNYDEIDARKIKFTGELAALKEKQENEIKDVKKSNIENKEETILAIKAKYFPEISRISGELNDIPVDKVLKAMRKEEINEVQHSYNRDKKYLKTNFTELSFAKEEAINHLLVNYKLPYDYSSKIVDKIIINDKKNKEIRHLSKDEVNKIVCDLEAEQASYITDNPSKFVGKCKTFKEQINSLLNENFHITILTIPVLGVILFTVMPLFFSIMVAFTNYSYGHIPPTQLFTWAGWLNFNTLFNAAPDSIYAMLPSAILQTLGWTIVWTIIATFSNYFLGIILALMINKEGIRLKKLWRTIFILTIAIPQFITLMSIGVALKDTGAFGIWWAQAFGYRLGFGTDSANGALVSKIIIIIVNIWIGIPYTMLSTTGILMNIPKDLYESAKVDGAGAFTQFNKITLPYILFVTGPYLITQFIGNFNNFNVIYFLTGGGPNLSGTALQIGHTDLLITFLYKMITSNNNPQFGIASAVGIVIFVICSFFSIIMYNKSGAVQSEDQFQ